MELQVAALQREVTALHDSLQTKDATLGRALEDGSAQVQEFATARQELLEKLEVAEQQLQVLDTSLPAICWHLLLLECSQSMHKTLLCPLSGRLTAC